MTNAPKASFWYRLLATYLDLALIATLNMLFLQYAASQRTLPQAISALMLYALFLLVNPLMVFQSAILTYYFGGNVGKLLVGLRVTDEHGKRLSFKRVFFRQTLGYQFSGLLFGLGFFSILKDPHRQGWHDKAVGSVVVITRPLWLVGIILSVIFTVASISLFAYSVRAIVTGPLQNEAQQLFIRSMIKMQPEKMQKTTQPNYQMAPEEPLLSPYPSLPQSQDATI